MIEVAADAGQDIARLEAFALSLVEKRKEAIDGRAATGIDTIWQEDREFYDGVDDTNREGSTWNKPSTADGRLTKNESNKATKSTVFVNITQPYVDMFAARVADMLLPSDDKPFGIQPTPMPDIVNAVKDPGQLMVGGQMTPIAQIAQQMIDEAKTGAEKAETQIWDWLIESQWQSEGRMIIDDSAQIGTGVLKGPVPIKVKNKAITTDESGAVKLQIVESTKPGSKKIRPEDFYPDPACGASIHDGSYTWERDGITARQLKELKGTLDPSGQPMYLDDQIDLVLKEGPGKKYTEGGKQAQPGKNDQFEIWYFHGTVGHEELRSAGCECEEGETVPAIVTMVNDRVIKASISQLDSGEFPYDVMVLQRRPGTWTGIGMSRQIRTPQRMLNAATRNLMDNAGLSSGPQLFMRRGAINPADGKWEITPRKVWWINEDADVQDVNSAIKAITIETMQPELLAIINYAMELAEKVTNMPLMMQGHQGGTPETAEGRRLLQNNASAVLRRIAKIFDDLITEPHIRRYYEWILLYGKDDSMKGDWKIDARGASALFERDAQNQEILQMGGIVKDPAFKIDPAKWIREAFKAQKLDPKRFQYTEEEWQNLQKNMQPQEDPRAKAQKEVATIRVNGDMEQAKLNQSSDMAELKFKAQEADKQRVHEKEMANLEYQMKLMEFAQGQRMSLDQAKVKLTDTALKLKTQKELSREGRAAKQVATPAVEPAGRAPNGMGFQK